MVFFKIAVIHAHDDIKLLGALGDHADVDVVLAERGKETPRNARPEHHAPANACDKGDAVRNF